MIRLAKPIVRVVPLDGTEYVVTLHPNRGDALLAFREYRKRDTITVSLEHVLARALRSNAEKILEERRERRRSARA